MKQKILFRVTMTDDKTRAKAMTKAVQFKGKKTFSQNKLTTQMLDLTLWFIGVSAVEIKGDHRNQIEVTGTEVDMICLTKMLRKKVAFAELVSVSKVEPPKKPEEEKKPAPCKPCPPPPCKPCPPPPCNPCPPPPCKPCPPPPCNPCPPPPCYPSPQGYGVPSAFPYPCNPYSYIGEPVYNHEPSCTIL
ncbi:PREDICTED: formin-B isoform X1 [Brassica oleracea var. oleracea]|uniref:HMA domain-containing protein n=1 Tax=Brassica oleracea var. oleracea TaxID=109376 RepID=A0A0D3DBR2_BRAOL|nr:PREDICTED: formin-B isoform X1 [Brassica oleracea var. oleracea]